MPSPFFSALKQKIYRININWNRYIDCLEQNRNCKTPCENIPYGIIDDNKHKNTPLLLALAWNRINAALQLLNADIHRVAINLKDQWPSSQSTALIMAAKINSRRAIKELINKGAEINEQDYRDFTALHYACLYRNAEAIETLLEHGADPEKIDVFGKTPLDYYLMKIDLADVSYAYGHNGYNLNDFPDMDEHYYGTQRPCLSAIRWYLAHLIVNGELGKEFILNGKSLFELAQDHLNKRVPVTRMEFYQAMAQCFLQCRPSIDNTLSKRLRVRPELQDPLYQAYPLKWLIPVDFWPGLREQKSQGILPKVNTFELKSF